MTAAAAKPSPSRVRGGAVIDARVLRNGVLYSRSNQALSVEASQQQFTRWYGLALTFP
jgi:hypothetical protein